MEKKLTILCNDIFLEITQLRQLAEASSDFGDSQTLRSRISKLFNELENQGRAQNIDSEDVRDVKFALAAFLDEIIISSKWPGKESWQINPLAAEYFDSWNAGNEFYDKLKDLRSQAHTRHQVLEVYYLCLTLGFKGQYGLYGPEKLKMLIDEIYSDLKRHQERATDDLSPHWQRSDELVQQVSGIPIWAIVLSGGGLAILFLFIMQIMMGNKVSDVVEALSQLIK